MEQEVLIGKVVEYIDLIGQALIELTDAPLEVGDSIHVRGDAASLSQMVEEMQMEGEMVERAEMGQKVKVKMDDKVQVGDEVYKVVLEKGA